MSWQEYVDNQLIGTGKIVQAAIYGHNGSLWATSPGFSVCSCYYYDWELVFLSQIIVNLLLSAYCYHNYHYYHHLLSLFSTNAEY